MFTVFQKELKVYFQTSIAYIFMGVYLLLFGIYFTYSNIIPTPNNNFTSTLEKMILLFIIVSPILTMRTVSEERKNRTDQLLLTSPKSLVQIVLGKFFAVECLFLLTLLITFVYPTILQNYGEISFTPILIAYLGFFLLGSCFLAIGIFISSLTESQVVAGVGTLGISILLWLITLILDYIPLDILSGIIFTTLLGFCISATIYYFTKNMLFTFIVVVGNVLVNGFLFYINKSVFEGVIVRFLSWFALPNYSKDSFIGILNIADIVYYLSFMLILNLLTIRVIERRRWI